MYKETNRKINERIQTIAEKFQTGKITERERNELFGLIYPQLKYYIWNFCKNEEDTEEALQFSLEKIICNLSKFNSDKGRFTTWAYTISRNETLYFLYKKNKYPTSDIEQTGVPSNYLHDEVDLGIETDCDLLYNITIDEIYGIGDTTLKNIAIDKMINKEKIETIAERYSIKPNTVKTKLRKIRSDLKDKVIKEHPHFRYTLNEVFDI